ncbi:hypothetical protein PHLGIDRAFT_76952 [Phlebiopsis gigantea 11061_1 CR5-6]|uniref:Uncharacterized protein n=1 Tax=Phlebiopsis gigantea (strain 11061_1 CR5-6) TaxID=745531 RepID=A0A0C3S2I5_PHLG1|nr:hypothetical protein PHLGIDRAFT_76952 [Phlebiopsis gigantea 11061_1 CR5-6]
MAKSALDPHDGQKPSIVWSYFVLTRLHKFPAGSNLAFWPGAWGITLSAFRVGMTIEQALIQLGMYLLGCTLCHSAGCIWNDICDREFDRKVAVSLHGAVFLLAVLVALWMVTLSFAGHNGIKVGLFGFLSLVPWYPLMKRWTYWPQAFLGLAMTWALPTSWASINGFTDVSIPTVLLAGGISWTIYYDTIYACQDRGDDIQAGVKSTAVLFGSHMRSILCAFASGFVMALVYTGVATGASTAYFIVTVLMTALELAWQMYILDFTNEAQCWKVFKVSNM